MKTKFKILLMALGLSIAHTQSQAQAIRFETTVGEFMSDEEYYFVDIGYFCRKNLFCCHIC